MDRLLLSRQPICRVDFTVFGYELLFRDSDADVAKIADAEKATAQVVVNLMEIGLKQLVENHQVFINVSRDFLLTDFSEALPPGQIVFELLEPLDIDRALIRRIHQLTAKGYRLATGEFVFREGFEQLLELTHIVKFDLQSNSRPLKWNVAKAAEKGAKLAAERVETFEQFDLCRVSGFDYFQGYFFCRPETIQTKRVPLSRMNTLRLMEKLNDPKLRIDELEAAIRQDLSLSYKMLKFVGSAACPVRTQINSIRHAAVLIGIERLKMWASLILFSGIQAEMKELTTTAIIRARMCEKLAEAMRLANTEQFFLVGMFSLLDAMLNQPLLLILKSLNFAPEINDALLYHHGGALGEVLQCVKAYERRAWEDVHCGNLDSATIREIYVKAVSWSIQTLTGFSDVIGDNAAQKETAIQLRRSSDLR